MISSYKNNLSIDFSGWFIKLADFADKAEDSSILPKVELILQTGNVITGSIIGYDRTMQEKLLMVLRISAFDAKSEVTIVPGMQVAAITFLDANSSLTVLENKSVISSLELKRAAKKTEEDLDKYTTGKINLILDADSYPEEHRRYVLEIINLLPALFSSLAKDEFGRKAIDENIDSIKIAIEENSTTSLTNKELLIAIKASYIFPEKEKERIKKEIESLL
jgi:hypothetical protein